MIAGGGWHALYAVPTDDDAMWDYSTVILVPIIAWADLRIADHGTHIAGWVVPHGVHTHEEDGMELVTAGSVRVPMGDGRVATFVRYVADTWRPEDGI